MPGVPSSRGCDGCRRQKKKCDQAQPSCGRCARLNIPCVGCGQQRYKFHNRTVALPTRSKQTTSSRASSSFDTESPTPGGAIVLLSKPSSPPSSSQSTVAARLVCALEIMDPRFDLSVYGAFVRDIPQRVGSHGALDAATDALMTSLPLVQAGQPTAPMLQKYGRALQALRLSLGSPSQLGSPNTLCALYLMAICQGWMRNRGDPFPSHGEAVANILKLIKGHMHLESEFDRNILSTLCFLVIMESFINPRIQLDPDLWHVPEPFGPRTLADESMSIDSLTLRSLSLIVALTRDPLGHQAELADAYTRVCVDRNKLAAFIATVPVIATSDGGLLTPLPLHMRRLHMRCQTGYGILTLVSMRLNVILQNLSPLHSGLSPQLAVFVDDIIQLAEHAMQYRPLGSGAVPMFLLAAFTALPPGERIRSGQIKMLLAVYRPDLDLDQVLGMATSSFQTRAVHMPEQKPQAGLVDESVAEEVQSSMRRSDLCCIL